MKTLILAGGKGTRLWPLSRELMPKQFIKLFGERSLFQRTVERALLFSKPSEIFVVTNEAYRFRILDDLRELGIEIPGENILLEPLAKNTLPAILWATLKIEEDFGNSVVAVLPSDHVIEANDAYQEAFERAGELAKSHLVTFGIKPTRPHTGYGYIKPGEKIGELGYRVAEFKEKPDLETAKRYVESGYYWNSGMFAFSTSLFIEEVRKHAPDVWEAFEEGGDIEEVYNRIPEISIDYGVMERTDKAAVVPLNSYWNDLGSFDAIYEALEKDEDGNAVRVSGHGAEYINHLIRQEPRNDKKADGYHRCRGHDNC